MRRTFLLLIALLAVACAVVPATAAAAAGPPPDTEAPIFLAKRPHAIPAGFAIDPAKAIAIAKKSKKMQAIHRTHHPLQFAVYIWVRDHYEVYFYYHGKLIADQLVGPDGQLGPTYTGPLMQGLYARGKYGGPFDTPWVLGVFTAMFIAPLLLLRGRSWFDRFDLAAVLLFGVSYALFDTAHLEFAVWMFYPPLLYLLVRMLLRGMRPRPAAGRLGVRLPTAVLCLGLLALVALRVVLALDPPHVVDVGVASALGAFKILHGQPIYFVSLGHPDTYGPLAYLAYAPFEAIWGGSWSYLPAVRAATITFDLLTIAGLVALGTRLRRGRDGLRLGLLLAWLWAACPFSLLGVIKNTNDGLVALIVVLIMLSLNSPIRRGVLVGIGAASKFFPAILLPLVAVGRGNADQSTVRKVLAGFVIAVGASFALFLPPGGIQEVWDHTLGFQLTRSDVFSIWALHSSLAPLKLCVTAFAAILAVALAFRPRGRRSPAQVAALAAAVTIAVQLPALHWFYLYIVWFLPLVLIAVLAADDAPAADDAIDAADTARASHGDAEPVLAGTA